jgi:hypothetical protein
MHDGHRIIIRANNWWKPNLKWLPFLPCWMSDSGGYQNKPFSSWGNSTKNYFWLIHQSHHLGWAAILIIEIQPSLVEPDQPCQKIFLLSWLMESEVEHTRHTNPPYSISAMLDSSADYRKQPSSSWAQPTKKFQANPPKHCWDNWWKPNPIWLP